MGWLSRFFGKESATKEPPEIIAEVNFVKLQDAVAFKPKATDWIRTQNSPPGTLMWFTIPFKKNQHYQPSFAVFADSVLYDKIERSESFELAFVPADSPSSFQWGIGFEDPDNHGTTITLVTDPLRVNESSLARLRYLAEHVRVHYIFYASMKSSNFVYIEMFPEFNDKLYQLYVELKKALTESVASEKEQPRNKTPVSLVGPKTPPPTVLKRESKNGQLAIPRLEETTIAFADGTVIELSDIKEISDGEHVLGAPNHPLMRAINKELAQGHGVVYLLFVSGGRSSTLVIPMMDQSTAIALIERIKSGKASLKKPKSSRVVVGECTQCHRKLRVREHAVKPQMVLTCKCGKENLVHTLS